MILHSLLEDDSIRPSRGWAGLIDRAKPYL